MYIYSVILLLFYVSEFIASLVHPAVTVFSIFSSCYLSLCSGQLLLLGDRVEEALAELENSCLSSTAAISFRFLDNPYPYAHHACFRKKLDLPL